MTDHLTPDDDAALRMLAGASFGPNASLILPSGKALDPNEAQALTSVYAADSNADPQVRYERARAFIEEALASSREPRPDWRAAVEDLLGDLDRIVYRNAHPDDVMWARLAMNTLTGIWLTVEEGDALHLGER